MLLPAFTAPDDLSLGVLITAEDGATIVCVLPQTGVQVAQVDTKVYFKYYISLSQDAS